MGTNYSAIFFRGVKITLETETIKKRLCSHPDQPTKFCSECGKEMYYSRTEAKGCQFLVENEDGKMRYRNIWQWHEARDFIYVGRKCATIEPLYGESEKIIYDPPIDLELIIKFLKEDGFEVLDSGDFLLSYAH